MKWKNVDFYLSMLWFGVSGLDLIQIVMEFNLHNIVTFMITFSLGIYTLLYWNKCQEYVKLQKGVKNDRVK